MKIPFLDRVFRKFIDGREVGNVDFNDSIITRHQAGRITVRMRCRSHSIAELVVDKLLFNFNQITINDYYPIDRLQQ